ncbi:hypothetical protein R1flu_018467 [Riccia fluitans]|uniref:Uncharacterized protein n=1 Tax=Riccia fluitans TaxID=41844 RepID=A0ABD1ZFX7_9MARC
MWRMWDTCLYVPPPTGIAFLQTAGPKAKFGFPSPRDGGTRDLNFCRRVVDENIKQSVDCKLYLNNADGVRIYDHHRWRSSFQESCQDSQVVDKDQFAGAELSSELAASQWFISTFFTKLADGVSNVNRAPDPSFR